MSVPFVVQSTSTGVVANSSTISLTGVSAGNVLIACCYDGTTSGQTITFEDSQSNNWVTLASANLATDGVTIAVGCATVGASGNVTVTYLVNGITSANSNGSLYEAANTIAALDVSPVSSNTLAQTAMNSGPMTTIMANDLLIAFGGLATFQTPVTEGVGWSNSQVSGNGNLIANLAETQIGTAPGNYTGTSATYSTSCEQAMIILALLPFFPIYMLAR